jgi:AcrR family transcriptional regulator
MYALPSPGFMPRRLDARRNREMILRVAGEAFARSGDLVSLDDIARRAGLGRATVYRHFPDRNALGFAVASERLASVARRFEGSSFRDLLHAVLRMQVEHRSLVQLFRELPERAQWRYTDALLTVLRPAFRRAQEEGSLRRDFQLTDLPLVFEMVEGALAGGPSAVDRSASTERLVRALLDGLFDRAA